MLGGVTGCWLSVSPSGGYAACVGLSMRTAEAPARVCVVPPRGSTRASSRKTRELAIQVHLCVVILLDFASRVLGIGLQAALDRVRPGDSIFLLVSVPGRFDK